MWIPRLSPKQDKCLNPHCKEYKKKKKPSQSTEVQFTSSLLTSAPWAVCHKDWQIDSRHPALQKPFWPCSPSSNAGFPPPLPSHTLVKDFARTRASGKHLSKDECRCHHMRYPYTWPFTAVTKTLIPGSELQSQLGFKRQMVILVLHRTELVLLAEMKGLAELVTLHTIRYVLCMCHWGYVQKKPKKHTWEPLRRRFPKSQRK